MFLIGCVSIHPLVCFVRSCERIHSKTDSIPDVNRERCLFYNSYERFVLPNGGKWTRERQHRSVNGLGQRWMHGVLASISWLSIMWYNVSDWQSGNPVRRAPDIPSGASLCEHRKARLTPEPDFSRYAFAWFLAHRSRFQFRSYSRRASARHAGQTRCVCPVGW